MGDATEHRIVPISTRSWRVARITKRQLDDAPAGLAAELRVLLAGP